MHFSLIQSISPLHYAKACNELRDLFPYHHVCGQHSAFRRKRRSFGELMSTPSPLWPAQDLNLTSVPKTNALPFNQLAGFSKHVFFVLWLILVPANCLTSKNSRFWVKAFLVLCFSLFKARLIIKFRQMLNSVLQFDFCISCAIDYADILLLLERWVTFNSSVTTNLFWLCSLKLFKCGNVVRFNCTMCFVVSTTA